MVDKLLEVKNLRVELQTKDGVVPVIDDLSFDLDYGESLSFVGESGCGKSMTALALMGLLPEKVGRIASGSIKFEGRQLANASSEDLRKIRGNEISMIFQEPMTSLNPVLSVGEQISEVLRLHQKMSVNSAWKRAEDLLDAVNIPDPKRRVHDYPFQMSGGQRQRVMIAMALACEPKILIADEPTTALDVTVQAQIFGLLKDLQTKTGTSIILITHDMGAVAQMARKMIVMYAGRPCEIGEVAQVIKTPQHPYTTGLISCVPHLDDAIIDANNRLSEIPGIVPSLREFGSNKCLFASRCKHQMEQCRAERPVLAQFSNKQAFACWKREIIDAG
ncbi:oligopeptide/dipeptide ABC transporter, ATP-binding protein [Rhodobacteraceae bacterium HIMB11]|nr:oligopeptide/dipeptide ABC transporter, ATP-binding protein [Rhodobacteraceae bacterium HIMB11]